MWKCMSGVEKVAKRLGYPLRLPLANEVDMPEYDWGGGIRVRGMLMEWRNLTHGEGGVR